MALSDHEQRLLEEMERQLYKSEADVLSPAEGQVRRPQYRAIVIGVVAAIAGIAVLILAVILNVLLLGMAGFVVMLVGVLFIFSPKQQQVAADSASGDQKSSKARSRSSQSFASRMEQRWQERGEGLR